MAKSVLLIGADSLLGREVRDRYTVGAVGVRLQSATLEKDAAAVFAASEEEIEVVAAVDATMIDDAVAVVASNFAKEALSRLREADSAIPLIDLTGALEDEPGAVLRAPLFEVRPVEASIHLIPQPGAWLLASFLNDLHTQHPVLRSVVTLFEPASQSGRAAIDELQKQTVALLSFKPIPKTHYAAQLSFNLLSRTGEESKISLPEREARIHRELKSLSKLHGAGLPAPSVRLIHAPTFHGYAASVWVEFATRPNIATIIAKLKVEGVDVRDELLDPPTNTGAAGQSGYAVGAIEADRNHPTGAWFWLAADNFRLQADLTIEVLRELL
ncbi:MAG: Asd/ArgC dimerization domain-containing protein [Bryobacteraceae bacterium]